MTRTAITGFLFCCALPAAADFDNLAGLSIIPGWTTERGTHIAGLNIQLAEGWKTYWRAPGDGGIPPVINLASSINVATAQFHWPVPEVFDQNGMRSVGYMGGVILPIELAPRLDGPMHLSGTLQIGVCEEICIPVTLDFDAPLEQTNQRDPSLLAAVLDRPQNPQEAGVRDVSCKVSPLEDGLQVMVAVSLPSTGQVETMVIEAGDSEVWVSEPDIVRQGGTLYGTVDMIHMTGASFALDRSRVRTTILGSDRAVDVMGCAAG